MAASCPSCDATLSPRERAAGWCEACGKRLPSGHGGAAAAGVEDRPWLPAQLLAATFLFGPLAGGMVGGINFARLGKPGRLVPCVLAGAVLFLALAGLVVFVVPEEPEGLARMVGLLANLGVGLG